MFTTAMTFFGLVLGWGIRALVEEVQSVLDDMEGRLG